MSCSCSSKPLTFYHRVYFHTEANLPLGDVFGGEKLHLKGYGFFLFRLEAIPGCRSMRLSITDAEITYEDFEVPFRGKPFPVREKVIGPQHLDLNGCVGEYDPERKHVHFTVTARLRPDQFPELAERLKIAAPITVRITEEGKFDLETGDFETHAKAVDLDHSGFLLSYRNSKSKCKIRPHLAVALTAVEDVARVGNTFVAVCPGHEVELGWMISGSGVQSAEIQPIGFIIPAGQYGAGKTVVKPEKTTEYTLVVNGTDCKNVKSLACTVTVAEPGTKVRITAYPNGAIWQATLPGQFYDPKMMMTSIQWVECLGTGGIAAIANAQKIDLDGTIHAFNVSGIPSSPQRMQVAGQWGFYAGVERAEGSACFDLTVSCQ